MDENRTYRAVVLDMDGVVTNTATLHAQAWKSTFDDFLQRHDSSQKPFALRDDYEKYVDGLGRYEGVRSFLSSRGIELPEGETDDTLQDGTIRGIGNEKNRRFQVLLDRRGPDVYEDAFRRIKAWRSAGVPVGIVSSSRNCDAVLQAAGISEWFDVRIDGISLEVLGLESKPEPDMYTEAARLLGCDPADCIVFEDARAGVEAGRRGEFGLVVGVDRRGDRADELRRHGADIVVESLDSLQLHFNTGEKAMLLDALDDLQSDLDAREPALFLDYDGTLTPIVERPEMATLDPGMRDLVRTLSESLTVCIVSGRDRRDVQRLVGLENLVYAGSHGFDIKGPDSFELQHPGGVDCLPKLDSSESALREQMAEFSGVQVERKRYSIAVHYRNADENDLERIQNGVEAVVAEHDGLKLTGGKAIHEIRPDIDWDKGRAVMWLVDSLNVDQKPTVPLYIGDDVTDEDAFRAIADHGIGILVSSEDRETKARYRLSDVDEVRRFLEWLVHSYCGEGMRTAS